MTGTDFAGQEFKYLKHTERYGPFEKAKVRQLSSTVPEGTQAWCTAPGVGYADKI